MNWQQIITENDISTRVLVRSMSSLARYASGASAIFPLANKETDSDSTIGLGNVKTLNFWIRQNAHLIIQAAILLLVIGSLASHIVGQRQQSELSAFQATPTGVEAPVFDELSSSEVAAVVALTTDTIVSDDVVAMAEEVDAGESVAATSENFVSKPAVALTDDASSEGITTYTVAENDSVASIAKQFGVTTDTIIWANNLEDGGLNKGMKLKIPPVNGVLYTVQEGDNSKTIADKFGASAERILAFNDAELSGLKVGQKIIIPGGSKDEIQPAQTDNSARDRVYAAATEVTTIAGPASGGQGYYAGYCTWYAAAKGGMPAGLGNAYQWAGRARAMGMHVSGIPTRGAVAQRGGGLGHVGIVEDVKKVGGRYMIKYSDMNGLAGFGRVGKSGWVPASTYSNYIHR